MSLDLSLNDYEINFKGHFMGEIDGYEFADPKILFADLLLLKDDKQVPLRPRTVKTLLAK